MTRLDEQIGTSVFVALDVPNLCEALKIVTDLKGLHVGYKVGFELTTAVGLPAVVRGIHDIDPGAAIFADLKLKDIPNTVSGAIKALPDGVEIVNLHASGGSEMMSVAAKAAEERGVHLFAVTVLTSMSNSDSLCSYGRMASSAVAHFSDLAEDAGCDGIICSAQDLASGCVSAKLLRLTPGIRPKWAAANDQKRITTPAQAMLLGADGVVIGRPVTNPPTGMTRVSALKRVRNEIKLIEMLKSLGGITQGHYVYASGRHGPMYFNKDVLLQDDKTINEVAQMLVDIVPASFDVIVGPETGGAKLAKAMHIITGKDYATAFKKDGGGFAFSYLDPSWNNVLLVEDVLTTGGSVEKVKNLVESPDLMNSQWPASKGDRKVTAIRALLNRGGVVMDNLETVANIDAESHTQEECQQCKDGIPISPKPTAGR